MMGMHEKMVAAGLWDALDQRDPDESMSSAWQVVEKMREQGWWPDIDYRPAGWFCTLYPPNERGLAAQIDGMIVEYADTAPEAICLAALAAVGAES